jgi:hypothetical protein
MSNFQFIKQHQPELAELGEAAEQYIYCDPQAAAIKLRCFGELFVAFIYKEYSLPTLTNPKFFDKLNHGAFKNAVEECIVEKLHALRMKGNDAAHYKGTSVDDALWLTKEAYFLSAWLYCSCHGGKVPDVLPFKTPQPTTTQQENLTRDNDALRKKLTSSTEDLENAKKELAEAERRIAEAQEQVELINEVAIEEKRYSLFRDSKSMLEQFDFEPEKTRERINIQDAFAEYQLTDGQAKLVDELDRFLNGREENVFLLKGYAGTGKTFITKGLTEYFKSIGRNFILAAPTGKASKVISGKTKCEAYTIHKTIYSFADIKEYMVDDLMGSETYKFYADLAVNEHSADTVYIIDEASMISDVYNESEFFRCGTGYLLKDFLKYVNLDHNDHRKKVIFIGDDAQLPPVGMNTSPALDAAYLLEFYNLNSKSYELTEVVRQKLESGVIHNAIAIRKSLNQGVFNQLNFDMDFPDLEDVEYGSVIERYMESCDHKINAKSIIIAHSNTNVAEYNKRIREVFFPGSDAVCARDKVLAVNNSDRYGFFISNGEFGLVSKVFGDAEERTVTLRRKSKVTGQVEEIEVPLKFRDVEAGFRDLDGKVHWINAKIIESLLYSDNPTLTSDESKALYVDFCTRHQHLKRKSLEFKETLRSDPYFNALRLKFGYAITCHKAQGSEWEHVFVKCKISQAQLSAHYFRWLYTAITRTSNKLYLLERPKIKLGDRVRPVPNPGIQASTPVETPSTPRLPDKPTKKGPEKPGIPSVTIDPGETFGIPSSSGALLCLLNKVRDRTSEAGFEIVSISHNQYQEAYFFRKANDSIRININYNGRSIVSSVSAPQLSDISQELVEILAPLKGILLTVNENHVNGQSFEFREPFLEQYHEMLSEKCSDKNIQIANLEALNWCQRYYFERDGRSAVIDISYSGKHQITRYQPVPNRGSCPELVAEVSEVIENGFA